MFSGGVSVCEGVSQFGLSGWSCHELLDLGAEEGLERLGEFAVDVFVVFDEELFGACEPGSGLPLVPFAVSWWRMRRWMVVTLQSRWLAICRML